MDDPDIQTVLKTYQWFNEISSEKRKPFSQQDVALHFSEDAKMITNNKLICTGIQEHYDHFNELNEHYKSLQVDTSSIDAHKSDDRIYLHYVIKGVNNQNQPKNILVMGFMVVKNNRIALFNEVIAES